MAGRSSLIPPFNLQFSGHMRRLVESWLAAEREYYGNNQTQAIALLNKQLGMRVTHSRVSEWRRGIYTPSQAVLSHTLWRALPWLLKEAGLDVTDAQLDHIDRNLWVVKAKK
jgi:hypothetical protein